MNLTTHDWIAVGGYLAAIWYLRRDVNGLGAKTRRLVAEQIINAAYHIRGADQDGLRDFAAVVKRLLG